MTTETQTAAPSMGLEVSVDSGARASADFSDPSNPNVFADDDRGLTVEFNRDGEVVKGAEGDHEPDTEEGAEGTGEEGGAGEPLPNFDPSDPDATKAYENRFYTFDGEGKGTLNMGALEEAWEANGGSLPDGVYAYLSDATGISKEAIQEIEAGRVALRERAEAELYESFGGKDGFQSAFDWATTGGGYTASQKERFNAAVASKDPEVIREAYELLNTRYSATKGSKGTADRRRASPSRAVTAEAAPQASGTQGYKSDIEYMADARAKGFDNKEVRKRLEASDFWKGR